MQKLTLPEDCAEKNSSSMQRRRQKDEGGGGGGGVENWKKLRGINKKYTIF